MDGDAEGEGELNLLNIACIDLESGLMLTRKKSAGRAMKIVVVGIKARDDA